ncbi:hypothetical protein SLEP1_g56717 [Rubroshorea leprosula]|uniref:Uncharacterized protein n=1 Tax=Rubroshorea leprosula TaxID=152421 RepID=A0AAV5MKH3_9ROSI|nr:hypothetical protein SLEP1_g56717 [Rubroshorea leprosula]
MVRVKSLEQHDVGSSFKKKKLDKSHRPFALAPHKSDTS